MTKSLLPETFPKTPDRYDVLAEVKRRGMSLSGIAEDNGYEASVCRHGIARRNYKGAKAIADALGEPISRLFPGYHPRGHNSDANASLKKGSASRQKDGGSVDERAA
jgi:Ner family transcriptional regulator